MISRYNVWLNDVPLSNIDPSIYVGDIGYQAASPERSAARLAANDGQYSGSHDIFPANRIAISFMVREYSTQRRQEIVQAIIAWAINGGWLKTSDRIGQRIYVKPSRLPAVNSAVRWTDSIVIEFMAYDYPFWSSEIPTTASVASGSGVNIFVEGVHDVPAEAVITAEAALTWVSVYAGDSVLSLTGLTVAQNDTITISYTDEHHILEINQKSGNTVTSLLDKRAPTSSDDLVLKPGINYITLYSGDGSSTGVFTAKGVYL